MNHIDDGFAGHPAGVALPVAEQYTILDDHILGDSEGRHIEQIKPHPSVFDSNPNHFLKEVKYIIIHFTTGTRMENTISYVQRADAEGCAHLLIGRKGHVVQFVAFNRIAYHTGFSWWERGTRRGTRR